jgi:hypothetical protein
MTCCHLHHACAMAWGLHRVERQKQARIRQILDLSEMQMHSQLRVEGIGFG